MSIYVLSCGGDVALVVNNQTIITFDPQSDDSGVLEAIESAALSLANMTNSEINRGDVSAPFEDWSWDDVIDAHLPSLQSSTPLLANPGVPNNIPGKYRVTWAVDIDDGDADTPVEAAAKAYEIMTRKGSIAVCFDVLDQQGNTTAVDLLEQDNVYMGLNAALAELDEDDDNELFLWEVEVGLFDDEDTTTAIDMWTVYVAATSPQMAGQLANELAENELSDNRIHGTSFNHTSCAMVDPEDFRDAVDGQ